MKAKISNFSKKLVKKFFGFLSESGNKNEKVNVIVILSELFISMIFFALFALYFIRFQTGVDSSFLDSTLGLMFDPVRSNNDTLGNILTLLFINFPAVLLINGAYSIKNYNKDDSKKSMILIGVTIIILSLAAIVLTFSTSNQMLQYCSILTYVATFFLLIYFLLIKKIDYFSVRQLIFLYFSVILFIIIFILILVVIFSVIVFMVAMFVSPFLTNGNASSTKTEKYKIKRYDDLPEKGIVVDENGTPMTDNEGKLLEVRDIDERNKTAIINGEKVEIKEKK